MWKIVMSTNPMGSRYAKLIYAYAHAENVMPKNGVMKGNLGDAIQTLAIENIYAKLAKDDPGCFSQPLSLVVRDKLWAYDGEPCILPMQGWFGERHGIFHLPWPEMIRPVFIGFHLNSGRAMRERFKKDGLREKMLNYAPIGCRDRSTAQFLGSLGVEAYFSGCMTLTFDKRTIEPKDGGQVFIVDLDESAIKKLPKEIIRRARFDITHDYLFSGPDVTIEEAMVFEEKARKILDIYRREAGLVITKRIHVAMPCIAMGIPVIFINRHPNNIRFDVLQGIVPVYSINEMRFIDWNPKPVDIDELKRSMLDNAKTQLRWAANNRSGLDRSAVSALSRHTDSLRPLCFNVAMRRRRRFFDAIASMLPLKPIQKWLRKY